MLVENMKMAFSAIRANKMRSFLTMLGIIIGIGSVIAIVSIGDTMKSVFEGLYKDIGVTQAYLYIGYWVDDVRQSDYFTLDEMERIKEVFGDEIAYIDCSSHTSADAVSGKTTVKFSFTGIDYNYPSVQPVNCRGYFGPQEKCGHGYGQRQQSVWSGKCRGKDLSDYPLRKYG